MANLETTKSSRYTVGSVGRALDILDVIAGSRDGLTLTEISTSIATSKSATYALLQTMVERGHVRELGSGPRYQLGVALLRLADAALTQLPLVELAHPVLTDLSNELEMTTRLAVADDGLPLFLDRVDGPGMVRFHAPVGQRESPHVSAAGKAILATLPEQRVRDICAEYGMQISTRHTLATPEALIADLDRVRERGYATDDEEDADGVFCVATIFVDHRGHCAGAISTTFIKLNVSDERIGEIANAVRTHADRISALLGAPQPLERAAR
jgi:IclR family acetate operon transcriptional repressor